MIRRPPFLGLVGGNSPTGRQTIRTVTPRLVRVAEGLGVLHDQGNGFADGRRAGIRRGFLAGALVGAALVAGALKLGMLL
jgi:hypothetical protein